MSWTVSYGYYEVPTEDGWFRRVPTDADVLPNHDLISHELGQGCVCGPEVEHGQNGAVMYTHHALDGREVEEGGWQAEPRDPEGQAPEGEPEEEA